jgi:hypothetical protein
LVSLVAKILSFFVKDYFACNAYWVIVPALALFFVHLLRDPRESLIARARQRFWVWVSSQILPTEQHQTALNEVEAIALASGEDAA